MATPQAPTHGDSKATLHGRGGAGNIGVKSTSSQTNAEDFQTPTIKSAHYTTGRGGQGNITSNDSAENARLAQDVDAPKHHQNEPKGTYHWGRGGEGNMMTLGAKSGEKKQDKEERPPAEKRRSGSFQNAVSRGKEMLGLRGKVEKSGSAIEDE